MPTVWNSLEIVKLVTGILTPLMVVIIGYWITQAIKRLEVKQWTNQKILEKRLVVYDEVVPLLNDLLCFHCYFGNWKEVTPVRVIEIKRALDKKMNIYGPLFSKALFEKYSTFMDSCFEQFTGWGKDARIKSSYDRRADHTKDWESNMVQCFSETYIAETKKQDKAESGQIKRKQTAYHDLMEEFQTNLEIFSIGKYPRSKTPDANFH